MVMHWNTVSMANRKLSKLVMPLLGPCHPSLQDVPLSRQRRPCPETAHGVASSSARAPEGHRVKQMNRQIQSSKTRKQRRLFKKNYKKKIELVLVLLFNHLLILVILHIVLSSCYYCIISNKMWALLFFCSVYLVSSEGRFLGFFLEKSSEINDDSQNLNNSSIRRE